MVEDDELRPEAGDQQDVAVDKEEGNNAGQDSGAKAGEAEKGQMRFEQPAEPRYLPAFTTISLAMHVCAQPSAAQ